MTPSMNYSDSAPCQICMTELASREVVAVLIDGADGPVWAIAGVGLDDKDTSVITMQTGGLLSRVSSIQLTSNSLTVSVPELGPFPHHGRGPQIPPLIIRLYVWASGTAQLRLKCTGGALPRVGFVFGHAEAVGDWNWIDPDGVSVDWPVSH